MNLLQQTEAQQMREFLQFFKSKPLIWNYHSGGVFLLDTERESYLTTKNAHSLKRSKSQDGADVFHILYQT